MEMTASAAPSWLSQQRQAWSERQCSRGHNGLGSSVACHQWGPSLPASDPQMPANECQSLVCDCSVHRMFDQYLKNLPCNTSSSCSPVGSCPERHKYAVKAFTTGGLGGVLVYLHLCSWQVHPRLGIGNLLGNPGNGQVHHRLDAVDHVFHPFFYLGQRQTWTSHWSGKLPWKLGKRRQPRHHHRTEHLVHQSWRQSRIDITENLWRGCWRRPRNRPLLIKMVGNGATEKK